MEPRDLPSLLPVDTLHWVNDLCDALRHHSVKLFAIRSATPPSRKGLSHTNKERNADMMEALFWKEAPTTTAAV